MLEFFVNIVSDICDDSEPSFVMIVGRIETLEDKIDRILGTFSVATYIYEIPRKRFLQEVRGFKKLNQGENS